MVMVMMMMMMMMMMTLQSTHEIFMSTVIKKDPFMTIEQVFPDRPTDKWMDGQTPGLYKREDASKMRRAKIKPGEGVWVFFPLFFPFQ